MEIIPLGQTSLPMEIILEYLESLKSIYTAESYDLFMHNCNNFSNDFAMFLVGRGIPDHITSLPRTVLNTPFGQMMRPYLDQSMRSITQAPPPPRPAIPQPNGSVSALRNGPTRSNGAAANVESGHSANGHAADIFPAYTPGLVHNITRVRELDELLTSASKSCAVIFFTSSTCGPCKAVYPLYDELAAEAAGKAIFIKIDINYARDIASRYSIRATPTFMTYLKGQKEHEWVGGNPGELQGNVRLLIQTAYPPHSHTNLKLPTLLRRSLSPVTYSKLPPLDKLLAKMGDASKDPSVLEVKNFVSARHEEGAKEAPLPDLKGFGAFLKRATHSLPKETLFAVFDLLRIALVDPRVSGFFAEDSTTIPTLLKSVNNLRDCPYNLRIVTLHLACNLFTSPIFTKFMLSDASFSNLITTLVAASVLDDKHPNVRVAASSLAFNVAVSNHRVRMEERREAVPEGDQVELAASILQALSAEEESKEACEGLALALGFLVYCAPEGEGLLDLCKAMDASGTVTKARLIDSRLRDEVAQLLAFGS